MPDPKECRQRALEYVWLARPPSPPEVREVYLKLAMIWLRLARRESRHHLHHVLQKLSSLRGNDLGLENYPENSQHLVEERNDLQYTKAS